jgi:short-subunit dehydrogenase
MNLANRVIVITGASSGIGYKLAELLAEEKANIALIARRIEILDELQKKLSSLTDVISIKCDVKDKNEVKDSFWKIKEHFGKIDIVILNAGIGNRYDVEKFNSSNAEETFGVNLFGMIYCIEEVLHEFINRKEGMIVGVSSIADAKGYPRSAFYSASKAAVTILLESLRIELKKYNVRVVSVRPGWVDTPMIKKNEFKMFFILDAEKAARKIINGIKKEKRMIQFPFPIILGSRLVKILPGFLFDYFAGKHLERLRQLE